MTLSEEDYLKTIYHLAKEEDTEISTNAIAAKIATKPSSVSDMLKKLADKNLIHYKKYQGVTLTKEGKLKAIKIVRKHRLWEVFLVEKLHFSWDEVHDVAEELEHITSEKLIDKLDAFLGFPTEDPHGDSIPDKNGNMTKTEKYVLAAFEIGQTGICVGVKDSSPSFLQYLDKQHIALGATIKVIAKEPFDSSLTIQIAGKQLLISNKIASNLFAKIVL